MPGVVDQILEKNNKNEKNITLCIYLNTESSLKSHIVGKYLCFAQKLANYYTFKRQFQGVLGIMFIPYE
jgi:hypothetical protein